MEQERQEQCETLLAIKAAGRFKNDVPVVKALRDIKENGYRRYRGMMVDSYSASAFVSVYDALNEKNQAKLVAYANKNLVGAIGICFKMCK